MLELFDGDHVENDLQGLPDEDLIDAFLNELSCSQDALWQLTKWPGESDSPFFNVKGVESLQRRGYNIYRIRPLSKKLKKYRILYAYDAQHDQFYVLAVTMKRPFATPAGTNQFEFFDYEPTHPITTRICAEYNALRIPLIC